MSVNEPIAIVGMACIFPGASDVQTYWQNILAGRDSISTIPPGRDRVRQDAVLLQGDEISCTRGGFLPEQHAFSPIDYGIMPSVCEKVDPEQLLILETVDRALADAGISPDYDDLSHTETIIGRGGYLGNYLQQVHMRVEVIPQVLSVLRKLQPGISDDLLGQVGHELQDVFGHLNADRIPFGIPNITTGRVANRFNCMGGNYTVDAACASALVAADNSIAALQSGRADRVITGGVFLASNPSFWWTFSRLGALSKNNMIQPFSKDADGMLVGEGLGMLVLEPLSVAQKAGRRIYALLRGSATSSDGRGNAVLAPRKEGQLACLSRAYERTGIDPFSVRLIEGHGTGTLAGDQVELSSIVQFYNRDTGDRDTGDRDTGDRDTDCIPVQALGSVKSMIGHLMPAAGAAAMIKSALALHHRILPPTLHAENPAEGLHNSSLYLNTITRPWISAPNKPRRAGLNGFGFGGINAHVIMEETSSEVDTFADLPLTWPTELFLFGVADPAELLTHIEALQQRLPAVVTSENLARLSLDSCQNWQPGQPLNLSVVADVTNLVTLLEQVHRSVTTDRLTELEGHDDIFYTPEPLGRTGKVVFIFPGNAFPGLGDDYTERLAQLSCYLPFFRRWFDLLDERMADQPYPFSTMLFSPPGLEHKKMVDLKKKLRQLANSAAGVFMANSAGQDLMQRLGISADMVTGTSLGEWSALMAGGMISFADVAAMGSHLAGKDGKEIIGGLGLAQCSLEQLSPVLAEVDDDSAFGHVSYALDLSPAQVVFGGDRLAVQEVSKRMQDKGVWAEAFNMTPIHTTLCAPIADSQHEIMDQLTIKTPEIPVYSGATGAPYPTDPDKARTLLADNTVLPVQMRSLFSRLHDDGVRIFLQLGGGGKVLGPLQETLAGKPFFASSLDMPNTHPATQVQKLTGMLIGHGLELQPDILFQYRRDLLEQDQTVPEKKGPEAILEMAVPKLDVQTVLETATVSAEPGSVVQPPPLSLETIMGRQLKIANKMLQLQQRDSSIDSEATLQLLSQQQQFILSENVPQTVGSALPFIGKIIEHVPTEKMVIQHVLDTRRDCFLLDHTFIPYPEQIKSAQDRLPTLPMAMALEIMAEAALTFMPGTTIIALEHIRNKRWIDVSRQQAKVTLTITVGQVDVNQDGTSRLRCTISSDISKDLLHVSGQVVVGSMRPVVSQGGIGNTLSGKPCALDPETLYRFNRLYHGPCFQGIRQLDQCGDDGISGVLVVPEVNGLFSSPDRGNLVLAPGLIDVASQLIACWAWERGDNNFWVAPIAIDRLEMFGQTPKPGEEVQTTLLIRKVGEKTVVFDLVMERAGQQCCRISGWQDYRMSWSPRFMDVWQNAATSFLSDLVDGAEECSARSLEEGSLQGVDLQWAAHFFLHADELPLFVACDPARKKTWLMGRIAAKDAIRTEIERLTGAAGLYPSQVMIMDDHAGHPQVQIQVSDPQFPAMQISLSHKGKEMVAVAQKKI